MSVASTVFSARLNVKIVPIHSKFLSLILSTCLKTLSTVPLGTIGRIEVNYLKTLRWLICVFNDTKLKKNSGSMCLIFLFLNFWKCTWLWKFPILALHDKWKMFLKYSHQLLELMFGGWSFALRLLKKHTLYCRLLARFLANFSWT